MEILRELIKDNSHIMQEIAKLNLKENDLVCIKVNLPEYVDITSLLAMKRRMVDVAHTAHVRLRLVGKTTNLEVEKSVVRLFADRDDIFMSVDWRD